MAKFYMSPITLKLYKETDEGKLYEHDKLIEAMLLGNSLKDVRPIRFDERPLLDLQECHLPDGKVV